MSAPASSELTALLDSVARLDMFTVAMHPTDRFARENSSEHLHEHMLWLRDGQAAGWLFLCGPVDWDEDWDGSGLAVLRAESLEDAVAVAQTEPYHRHGLRHNVVRRWTVNEGTLSVKVDLLGARGQLC
jgi:uncharacterized protein YciI